MPTPILVSPQVRCPSCRNTLIFSFDTPGLISLADSSLEPALTSLSGTSADFSLWNQRWLLSLEPALSVCQPCSQALQLQVQLCLQKVFCSWVCVTMWMNRDFRIPNTQIDSIDQDNFISSVIKSCVYYQSLWVVIMLTNNQLLTENMMLRVFICVCMRCARASTSWGNRFLAKGLSRGTDSTAPLDDMNVVKGMKWNVAIEIWLEIWHECNEGNEMKCYHN